MFRSTCVAALAAALIAPLSAWAVALAENGKATATVVLGHSPTEPEKTAAKELVHYLSKVTGGTFSAVIEPEAPASKACIYVGPTPQASHYGIDPNSLGPEEWIIRTVGDHLVLAGGRPRGTLYAVYRFLEDVIGVHWWNPWEETIPFKPSITVDKIDRRGKPVFRYRDIYLLYANDGGRFAARNRLNRHGDVAFTPEYGGAMDYGPPSHVHNFYIYIPPQTFFAAHPEWFSLLNGKRSTENAQLCLTNKDLRAEFARRLKDYIKTSHDAAAKAGRPAPLVFDISQNDWEGMCQCEACQKIAKAEGSEAGPLLDFVNAMADTIRDEHPGVFIDTLAYMMTQKPPKTIKPRDNVIIRLCDTSSNFTKPITHRENRAFHDLLLAWSKISKNLRIWDYAVTYAQGYGLPLPTVHTYPIDYRFYADHNVEGVFTEHEYPILADLRDLKIWMMMKLLEDPYRDYPELVRQFTDGFYGPAGEHIRRYLGDLEAASESKSSHLSMDASPIRHRYLDLAFVREAGAVFDQAETAVKNDSVLLRRVRHARLPLDRAILLRYPQLVKEWVGSGNDPKMMPLDRMAVAERCRDTWSAQIDFRIPPAERKAEQLDMGRELKFVVGRRADIPMPERFRGSPPGTVFDFTAEETRNWNDMAKRVQDRDAETGLTNRLELPDDEMKKYALPISWGLYDAVNKASGGVASIKPEEVTGPGYHWYKMGRFRIGPSYYLYFFWSWIIQVDIDGVIDPLNPDQPFDVWARIKLEGPMFPHGKPDQKNAICVERVVLTKAPQSGNK